MMLVFFILCALLYQSCAQETLEQVTQPLYHVEGPHWDDVAQVLYYTDIDGQLVVRYDPVTGNRTEVKIEGGPISPILTVRNAENRFVAGRGRDLITFEWDGKSSNVSNIRVLATIDKDNPSNKFNDGKADTSGRIWAGSLLSLRGCDYIGSMETDGGQNKAALYYFAPNDFSPKKIFSASISNGLAWNDDDTKFYYIDSGLGRIDVFDYDKQNEQITNRRTLWTASTSVPSGGPDGMTLDANGNIWTALWGGSAVAHINTTTGELIRTVSVPALQVSSCTWGGRNMDTLYITTSREGMNDDVLAQWPLSGSVFALKGTGLRGQKNNKVLLS